MAESKRTFNSAKMNRDIDDRLLHPGEYRYAMNVNIGESEGGDIGAVENLKGNELITGQDLLNGTTIGVVRDPNYDRIYWFNKGDTVDGIYEYDERTGQVNPILLDQVSNPLQKPSCTPDFNLTLPAPDSDASTRPALPDLPPAPTGGCTDRSATNYNSGAAFDDGSCVYAPAPTVSAPMAVITGAGVGETGGDDIILSGTSSQAGTLSDGTPDTISTYAWTTNESTPQTGSASTFTVSAPSTDQTITVTLTITTGDGDTDSATHNIVYSSTPPSTRTFSWQPSGSIADVTIRGGASFIATDGTTSMVNNVITIAPDAGHRWVTLPTVSTSPALPTGVTGGDTVTGVVGSTAAATVTITGTWSVTADYTGTATISGGEVEEIPEVHRRTVNFDVGSNVSLGGQSIRVIQVGGFQRRDPNSGVTARRSQLEVAINANGTGAVGSSAGFSWFQGSATDEPSTWTTPPEIRNASSTGVGNPTLTMGSRPNTSLGESWRWFIVWPEIADGSAGSTSEITIYARR